MSMEVLSLGLTAGENSSLIDAVEVPWALTFDPYPYIVNYIYIIIIYIYIDIGIYCEFQSIAMMFTDKTRDPPCSPQSTVFLSMGVTIMRCPNSATEGSGPFSGEAVGG